MSRPRFTLEARLERFEYATETLANLGWDLALRVTLVLPRPNVADREVVHILRPEKGATVVDLSKEPVMERLLFKQTIQGPTGFRIQLSPITDPSILERLLTTALRAGVQGAGIWLGSEHPVAVRGIAREPFRFLGDLTDDRKLPEGIGAGLIDYHPSAEDLKKEHQTLKVAIHAVEDLARPVLQRSRQNAPRKKAEVLLQKGDLLGTIRLRLKTYR